MSESVTDTKTGIPMTRNFRIMILKRAREILSDRNKWTVGRLMRRTSDGVERFCLLGACEQAVYELGIRERAVTAFQGGRDRGRETNAYQLGRDLKLYDYARGNYGLPPEGVNDDRGYDDTMKLLDEFTAKVEKGEV